MLQLTEPQQREFRVGAQPVAAYGTGMVRSAAPWLLRERQLQGMVLHWDAE